MQRLIGYVRVSTPGQVNDGVSLELQAQQIQRWAELYDYHLIKIFEDPGNSGGTQNRPAFQEMMGFLESGDTLIIHSFSRLSRSLKDVLDIEEKLNKNHVELISLTEKIDTSTAAGKMIFRMLAIFAEFERDQIREKTKQSMDHKKALGQRIGSIPYGKKLAENGIDLEDDSDELEVIKLSILFRKQGMSYREIREELEKKGYKARGKKWHPKTLSNIIEANLEDQ